MIIPKEIEHIPIGEIARLHRFNMMEYKDARQGLSEWAAKHGVSDGLALTAFRIARKIKSAAE